MYSEEGHLNLPKKVQVFETFTSNDGNTYTMKRFECLEHKNKSFRNHKGLFYDNLHYNQPIIITPNDRT